MLTIVTTTIMETDYSEEFQFKIMNHFNILTFSKIASLYQILI